MRKYIIEFLIKNQMFNFFKKRKLQKEKLKSVISNDRENDLKDKSKSKLQLQNPSSK
jgi:hypothetical protein